MKSSLLNTEIRELMKKKGLAQYEVANELGISPGTFAHWLQSEITGEKKERVLRAIENINE